mmetsp:Transcript_9978/g.22189  ORF Transcript_9978/g.22189 Transcript_9978/m.22189 type:complete len:224 (+) Transcript_9978:170-841(+)
MDGHRRVAAGVMPRRDHHHEGELLEGYWLQRRCAQLPVPRGGPTSVREETHACGARRRDRRASPALPVGTADSAAGVPFDLYEAEEPGLYLQTSRPHRAELPRRRGPVPVCDGASLMYAEAGADLLQRVPARRQVHQAGREREHTLCARVRDGGGELLLLRRDAAPAAGGPGRARDIRHAAALRPRADGGVHRCHHLSAVEERTLHFQAAFFKGAGERRHICT